MRAGNDANQWRSESPTEAQRLIEIYVYRPAAERVTVSTDVSELPSLLEDPSLLVWVDLHAETHEEKKRVETILLEQFKFHHLSVEDCLETRNQPKVEAFPTYLYFIVHGIKPAETSPVNFVTKELDGYLGSNFVVTFHIEAFRSISAVKQQILSSPFICQRGAAYLLHQILDQVVDHYMPLVDEFDSVIEEIETRVLDPRTNDSSVLEEIMDLRRSIARLRRIATRQREVLYRMSHGEFPQIGEHVLPFFRDVHDHLLRVTDLSENYRDLVAGLVEIHFSVVANKTNDVMKTLAVVSAIILPLSLIAGIYGMNFAHIPELRYRYGYFLTLGAMVLLAVVLLVYFRRRGWIFQGERPHKRSEKTDFDDL